VPPDLVCSSNISPESAAESIEVAEHYSRGKQILKVHTQGEMIIFEQWNNGTSTGILYFRQYKRRLERVERERKRSFEQWNNRTFHRQEYHICTLLEKYPID
jgi:hypothetical protein